MHKYRTHNCSQLRKENIDEVVKIAGWVDSIRDLGGLTFLDIRDHYGMTQVVISKGDPLQDKATKISRESTVSITGKVGPRPDNMVNSSMPTGEVEVLATQIEVLGKCLNQLPFEFISGSETKEDLRLKYRFLDLRNETLHNNIVLRSKVIQTIRKKMTDLDFLEIQTPILTSSSPEGARDYLVPSRVHPGKFYALPQAPQQFKQLLMVSGFDKYFQIAPCFRDEDARADRSPGEFYQLDLEMAYATQEDVFVAVEKVMHDLFSELTNWKVSSPFPKIPYKDAILKYGSDKPDLRNPLIIQDVSDVFADGDFDAFKNKTIRVIPVEGGALQSRKFFDKMVKFATESGAKGLAWIKLNEDLTVAGSIAKFITDDIKTKLIETTGAKANSAFFFMADEKQDTCAKLAGLVRDELGSRLDLIEKDVYKFCWIVDFPMYELDPETNKIEFSHNPFSMPQGGLEALNTKEPLDILAYQYDIVCNGIELSSGAVRNHSTDVMIRAFEIAGYGEDEIKKKFPALYNAFQYGAPPHAGIAPGVDRIVMLIAQQPNIREVIAFPMNSKAQDLLMGAPSEVSEKQLEDVSVKISIKE